MHYTSNNNEDVNLHEQEHILPIINYLCISQSIYPNCCKKALVVPIFKGGDPSSPNNYRPISLLPILSKFLGKILVSQINLHLNRNVLISNRQHGVRARCSTDQLLFQLVNRFKIMLNKKISKYISVAALDIKKAFDSVNHDILISKLNKKFNFTTLHQISLKITYLNVVKQWNMKIFVLHLNQLILECHKAQYLGHYYFLFVLLT